jgi:hypothetical protein
MERIMPSTQELQELLRQFADALGATETQPLTVHVGMMKLRYPVVECEAPASASRASAMLTPPMPPSNESWLWLSPTEKAIIASASEVNWMTGQNLALAANLPWERDLGAILRNLVERCILESSNGKGYRLLNPPRDPLNGQTVKKARRVESNGAEHPQAEPDEPESEDPAASKVDAILGLFHLKRCRLSLGEIAGAFPKADASSVRVAVQELKRDGKIVLRDALYSLPEQ